MQTNTRKLIAVVVMIALHLGSSLFIQISHHHILAGIGKNHATFQAHSCGKHEFHRDLTSDGSCVDCIRAAQMVAYVIAIPTAQSVLTAAAPLLCTDVVSQDTINESCRRRGPPSVLA